MLISDLFRNLKKSSQIHDLWMESKKYFKRMNGCDGRQCYKKEVVRMCSYNFKEINQNWEKKYKRVLSIKFKKKFTD